MGNAINTPTAPQPQSCRGEKSPFTGERRSGTSQAQMAYRLTTPPNKKEPTRLGRSHTHDAKGNLTSYEVNAENYTVTYDLDNRISEVDVDSTDVEKHRRLGGVLDRSAATCPRGVSRREAVANQYRYDAFGRRVVRKEGPPTRPSGTREEKTP